MAKLIISILFVFNLSFLYSQNLSAAFFASEDSKIFSLIQQWIDEVGQKAGITFSVESVPLDRAKQRLLCGLLDADISRSRTAYGNDPRVVYTSRHALETPFAIYTKQTSLDSQNIEVLKQYSLVTTKGNKAVEDWIETNKISNIFYVDNIETAFRMLELKRADYYIGPFVYHRVLEMNSEFSEIKVITPPIFILYTYIVLNIKHNELEPAISAAIKELAECGRTAQIFGVD